jgi:dTDP-4-amino-4,6-dideoxygalactose transaminase
MHKKIPLSEPNLDKKDMKSVVKTIKSRKLSAGQRITEFENELASFIGVKFAISTSSATTALHLALASLDNLSAGDEVILPAYTFPACVNTVITSGLVPVFVDISPGTLNIDATKIEKAITKKTKVIIPVDAFGVPHNKKEIQEIAQSRNLRIIEDAACALGARHSDTFVGNSNNSVIFSFHQRKIITTGEGGAITTNSELLAKRLKLLRSHGADAGELYSKFTLAGFNFRFNEMGAALGVTQLRKLEQNIAFHEKIAMNYRSNLEEIKDIDISPLENYAGRIYQSIVICLKNKGVRDRTIRYLRESNIETTLGTYYLPEQPAYKSFLRDSIFPVAKKIGETSLALPVYKKLSNKDIDFICQKLIKSVSTHSLKV